MNTGTEVALGSEQKNATCKNANGSMITLITVFGNQARNSVYIVPKDETNILFIIKGIKKVNRRGVNSPAT